MNQAVGWEWEAGIQRQASGSPGKPSAAGLTLHRCDVQLNDS